MQTLSNQAAEEELKLIAVDQATTINEEHAALLEDCQTSRDRAASARDRAVVIGKELVVAKEAVGHGRFMAWVKLHCSFSQETARRYMAVSNSNHGCNLPDDLSLRQAMVALDIIPHRPREGAGTSRGAHVPSVYDPLNALTRLLDAANHSGEPQAWETDEMERSAVQQQYKPKLEELILRLFGVKVELTPAI